MPLKNWMPLNCTMNRNSCHSSVRSIKSSRKTNSRLWTPQPEYSLHARNSHHAGTRIFPKMVLSYGTSTYKTQFRNERAKRFNEPRKEFFGARTPRAARPRRRRRPPSPLVCTPSCCPTRSISSLCASDMYRFTAAPTYF